MLRHGTNRLGSEGLSHLSFCKSEGDTSSGQPVRVRRLVAEPVKPTKKRRTKKMNEPQKKKKAIILVEEARIVVEQMKPTEENKGAMTGLEIALKFLTMRECNVHKATDRRHMASNTRSAEADL